MKKMLIKKRLYNVTSMEDYTEYKDLYNPKFTAIEGHGMVLPIKGKTDTGPGLYSSKDTDMVYAVVKPDESELDEYSSSHIIDYSNCNSVSEIINTENLVRNIENEILTTKDNIFNLNIGNDDSKEMVAMKQAINMKQVDIKQYEDRFDQFQNDIRLLKGKSITLSKIKTMCDNFDIEAELTLKDVPGCANPMGNEIKVVITERRDSDETV